MPTGFFPLWLLLFDWVIRLGLAAHVIYRRRPVNTSLAWLVVLMFMPIVGLFAYLLVGEVRLGSRRVAAYNRLTSELDQHASAIWKNQCKSVEETGENARWNAVARYGLAVTGFPPLRGNRIAFINDTSEFLDSIRRDIDAARHHVHLLTFIWAPSAGTNAIGEALERAARRGVHCRLLVDAVGSTQFLRSAWPARLRKANVQVVAALPANPLRMIFSRIDLRNHRKLVIIDGQTAFIGSQNITDSTYRSTKKRRTGPWIDCSARIEGPVVQPLALLFIRDWVLDSDEQIDDLAVYLPPSNCNEGPSTIQVIPSGPGPSPEAIHQAVLTTLYAAREEILMTTPYFVPDDATRMALQAAAARGVEVTLIMPSISDSLLVAAASRAHYTDLLEAGVRILHFTGGLLHAKTITVDRSVAILGSANFDQRSFFINFELSVIIFDDDSASLLRFMQNGYIKDCYQITLEAWQKRPLHEVLIDNTAQLLGPLL